MHFSTILRLLLHWPIIFSRAGLACPVRSKTESFTAEYKNVESNVLESRRTDVSDAERDLCFGPTQLRCMACDQFRNTGTVYSGRAPAVLHAVRENYPARTALRQPDGLYAHYEFINSAINSDGVYPR